MPTQKTSPASITVNDESVIVYQPGQIARRGCVVLDDDTPGATPRAWGWFDMGEDPRVVLSRLRRKMAEK
jgi:hypothetical protein